MKRFMETRMARCRLLGPAIVELSSLTIKAFRSEEIMEYMIEMNHFVAVFQR